MVKMLFGCGLRLFEGLQLRVRDFNFDAGMLTVHGKGKKDRTVPLPVSIVPELKSQMKVVGELHDQDLAAGFDGLFLDDAVEKKYPPSAQGVYPPMVLSAELLRYPRDSKSTGALQPENHHDLYSLRAGSDSEGTEESAGFVISRNRSSLRSG
jgi:integrase